MAMKTNTITMNADVLVVGAGWAGFFAAIKAREAGADVILVDKAYPSRSGASSENDGDFTVFKEEWGSELEAWKTQHAELGEYMNNPKWTEISCLESADRLNDLISWGLQIPRDKDGNIIHPFERRYEHGIDAIWIGWGNTTMPFVRKHAEAIGVRIVPRVHVLDLLKQDGVVSGAVGIGTQTADFYIFKAKATVVATGTSGFKIQLPALFDSRAAFDGEAMAYRAGAAISGMEFATNSRWSPFVGEFPEGTPKHPREGRKVNDFYSKNINWCFKGPALIAGDYTDADGNGQGFVHPFGLMAVHEGRGPLLQDLSTVTDEQMELAMTLYNPEDIDRFKSLGLDVENDRGLFSGNFSMAEGFMGRHMGGSGGVTAVGYNGGTTLPGLYGAGDSYHSAISGAQYPSGGTGLRTSMTTGARAGVAAYEFAKERAAEIVIDDDQIEALRESAFAPLNRTGGFDCYWISSQIANIIIPYYVFGVRSGERLKAALTMIDFLDSHVAPLAYATDPHYLTLCHDAKNSILGAKMMVTAALFREESRGLQYREDFPFRDDENWLCHVLIEQKDGKMTLSKRSIKEWWPELQKKPYLEKYTRRYRNEIIPD